MIIIQIMDQRGLCDMDEIDQANERAEIENDRQIAAIRAAAAEIPEGYPGEC